MLLLEREKLALRKLPYVKAKLECFQQLFNGYTQSITTNKGRDVKQTNKAIITQVKLHCLIQRVTGSKDVR